MTLTEWIGSWIRIRLQDWRIDYVNWLQKGEE